MRQLIGNSLLVSALGSAAAGLVSLSFTFYPVQASNYFSGEMDFVPPVLSDLNRPPGREGGGSRGDGPLIALVPVIIEANGINSNDASSLDVEPPYAEAALNLTSQDYPSFWFYISYVSNGNITLEFMLQGNEGNTIYQGQVELVNNRPGIVQIVLPESLPPLVIGEEYYWSFKSRCIEDVNLWLLRHSCQGFIPGWVDGWIERTSTTAEFQSSLELLSLRDQAALYARSGIWQDSLSTLAALYSTNSQDIGLKQDWIDLLSSAGLEAVSSEPFLGHLSLENY
jgi:hypothetical protein